jgi:hypothetical protein
MTSVTTAVTNFGADIRPHPSATDSHLIVTDGLSSFGRWRLPVVGSTLLREMRDTDVGRASQAQQLEEEGFPGAAKCPAVIYPGLKLRLK